MTGSINGLGNNSAPGAMRRIAVSLLKGGVAKSETAVSLAHGMAMRGLKVLLVDTDVQAQCSDMLGVHPDRGLAQVIAGWPEPNDILVPARENLWLLAGGNDLAGVKMEIARREMSPESVLDEALSQFDYQFDVMILDTAPGWDTLLVNALFCSHEVLSPVSMEPVALSGLKRFEERLAIIQKYNPKLALRWVVPTFVDGRVKKTGEILRQLHERYGDLVAPPIKYTVKLSEAPAFGKTIFEHDPKGVGAKGYHALTERVIADAPVRRVRERALPLAEPVAAGAPAPAVRTKVAARTISPRPAPPAPPPAQSRPVVASAKTRRPAEPPAAPQAEASPPVTRVAAPAEGQRSEVRIKPAKPVLQKRLGRSDGEEPPAPRPQVKAPSEPEPRPSYASIRDRLGQASPDQEPARVKKRSPYLSLKQRLQQGPVGQSK